MCSINWEDAWFKLTLDKIYRHFISFLWETNLNEFNQQIQSWRNYRPDVVRRTKNLWGRPIFRTAHMLPRKTLGLQIFGQIGKAMKKHYNEHHCTCNIFIMSKLIYLLTDFHEFCLEKCFILIRIQSKCGKIRTRITPNADRSYAVIHDGTFSENG